MNSLKTVLLVGIFGVLVYGAYELIYNKKPDTVTDDGGEAPPSPYGSPPTAELPGLDAINPTMPPPLQGTNPAGQARMPVGSMDTPNAGTGAFPAAPSSPSDSGNTLADRSPGALPAGGDPLPSPVDASHPLVSPGSSNGYFDSVISSVQAKLDRRELTEALRTLSGLYDRPGLMPEQNQQVVTALDQLAGTVIYSSQHLLEDAYIVQSGDTIEEIARKCRVEWQLLGKINGLQDPHHLEPGTKLKIVRGPFDAVIHLDRYELTMMLGQIYAGRFPIGIGQDYPQLEGDYVVTGKVPDPDYNGPQERIRGGDPSNPYGRLWVGLGERVGEQSRISLHGTHDPGTIGRTAGPGSIRLGERDIEDVYDILSVGSRVIVRR